MVVTIVIVGIFEELGWRGFLLPRLQRDYRALPAALIIGLAWFPWHLPELVSDPGQRPLTPFAVYIFSQSVLLAWLYNSTQASLPVVVLFHAAFNTFTKFFLADLQGSPYPYLVAWWVVAGAVAVLAVAAVAYAGSRDLVKGAPRPAH
ncbi:CPBP family intramembrane glutamic endopeptidase [Pseudarthrobacter oxydans]|uniref:CPBP family intramembrane glutamic endopeptidase n=1 Tax=Pseudarthrobacter oxydans TaxID=1671 RepID=UPI0037F5772E